MGSTADNESLAVVATAMQGAKLTVNCVQASFNLGHTVDTEEPIVLPVGVREHREEHLTDDRRVGAMSKLPKLIIQFSEPAMATVTIYPSGKVEVSRASSETAAQAAAEAVSNSLFRPEDADEQIPPFRITQMIATYVVLPKVIKKQDLYFRLEKMYSSGVDYEPENRHCVRLNLNQGVSKGRVIFEFHHGKILVRGADLGAGGSVLIQKLFLEVCNGLPIDEYLTEELQAGSRTAADLIVETNGQKAPDVRDALEKAIKKIVAAGPLGTGGGPRFLKDLGQRPTRDPAGGFISRHLQIQKWLRKEHPDLTQLPDYKSEWGDPGRANVLLWANTPWAGFWAEHMRPALDDGISDRKRKRDERAPADMTKSLNHYADMLTNSNTAAQESPARATSRHNLIALAFQLAEAIKKDQQLASDDKVLEDALQDELEPPVTRSLAPNQVNGAEEQPKGVYRGLGSGDDESFSADDSTPSFTSCSAAESAPSFTACSTDGSALSAGAHRATAGRILLLPGTAHRRSYAGVEVLPSKKLPVVEVNEAPSDVASRVLQALGGFACPETADLHDECVRMCKLIIAS